VLQQNNSRTLKSNKLCTSVELELKGKPCFFFFLFSFFPKSRFPTIFQRLFNDPIIEISTGVQRFFSGITLMTAIGSTISAKGHAVFNVQLQQHRCVLSYANAPILCSPATSSVAAMAQARSYLRLASGAKILKLASQW
jgi:hypothetical protein